MIPAATWYNPAFYPPGVGYGKPWLSWQSTGTTGPFATTGILQSQPSEEADRLLITMPGFRQDREWARTMNQAIQEAARDPGGFGSARKLLDWLANRYRAFKAIDALSSANTESGYYNPSAWWQFGRWRRPGEAVLPTPVTGRYSPYRSRAMSLALGAGGRHQARAGFGTNLISLTTTVIAPNGIVRWEPPGADRIPLVLARIEQLFQDTLALPGRLSDGALRQAALRNAAQIHWLLVQAMLFHRGTAGIADMMTKVLLDHLGIRMGPWQSGLAPDLEALVRPLDDFIAAYPRFFQNSPGTAPNNPDKAILMKTYGNFAATVP